MNDNWLKSLTTQMKIPSPPPGHESRLKFISGLNHELRGPLNGINGLTWLLESTELSHEQQQYVASLRHSADDLLRMLGDMVDMVRLDEGQMTVAPQATLIEESLKSVVDAQTMTSQARKLDVRLLIDAALSAPVMCDPQRLKQILNGLLMVALKSSSQSILEVSAVLEAVPSLFLRVRITDLTDGLGGEVLKRIQTLMDTIELHNRHEHGPLGHSLCVSKAILTMLGGQMGVEGSAGKRPSLWFSLPIEKVT